MNLKRYHILPFFIIALWMTASATGFGQKFAWKAPVKPVYSNGFYKIFLPPNATGHMQPDFADIRLYNKEGSEIPYVFYNDRNVTHSNIRHFLGIRERNHKLRKGYTRIVTDNKENEEINNLCFTLEDPPTDEVWVRVSGSNDLKKWVIIKDNSPYLLQETKTEGKHEVKIMDLPASNYKHYEIRIYDTENGPVRPQKMYYYDVKIRNINYTQIPEPEISQRETNEGKLSVVQIKFQQAYYLDKMELSIEGPKYFLRKAVLDNNIPVAEKKFNLAYYEQINEKFEISSERENVLQLTNYKAKELELVIENKDSEPLKVKNIKAYQIKKFLIARLEQGMRYTLYFGNENVQNPVYDLKYFLDSIQSNELPIAQVKHIMSVRKDETPEEPVFNIPPFYMWLGIGLVLLFMLFIAVRILQDLQKEKENQTSGK